MIVRLTLIVEIKIHAVQGEGDVYLLLSFYDGFYRFGFCGEDEGYCYPIEGCILRGVEIDGGDLTVAEGGGGVNVERGQLVDVPSYVRTTAYVDGTHMTRAATNAFLRALEDS